MCAYKQEISRQNKAYFLFLLDQSYSMEEPIGGSSEPKMDVLASVLNGWLQNMVIRATKDEHGPRDYMDVSVVGYRTDMEANPIIESPLAGPLAAKTLLSTTDIAASPRIEKRTKQFFDDDTGELMDTEVEVPIWIDPVAEGGTPMCSALYKAYELTNAWIDEHPKSFPPVVIHITDGESQEGDPLPYAEPLRELETEDGQVLLFNCHLSMAKADKFLFPAHDELLPDDFARLLFEMSSELPQPLFERAIAEGFQLEAGARGMAFNADMVSLIKFLDMGTRVSSLR